MKRFILCLISSICLLSFSSCSNDSEKDILTTSHSYNDEGLSPEEDRALDEFIEYIEVLKSNKSTRSNGNSIIDKLWCVATCDAIGARTSDGTHSSTARALVFSAKAYDMLFHQKQAVTAELIDEVINSSSGLFAMQMPSLVPTNSPSSSDSIGVYHNELLRSIFLDYATYQDYTSRGNYQQALFLDSMLTADSPLCQDTISVESLQEYASGANELARLFLLSEDFDDFFDLIAANQSDYAITLKEIVVLKAFVSGLDYEDDHAAFMNSTLSQLNSINTLTPAMKSELRNAIIVAHASFVLANIIQDLL